MTHDELLAALDAANFHLVGSRATGLAGEWSDWDFAGWASGPEEADLERLGFKTVSPPAAVLDSITDSVWQLGLPVGVHRIYYQVCLVTDLNAKLKAMEALKASKALRDLDRELRGPRNRQARKEFWNALFSIAR